MTRSVHDYRAALKAAARALMVLPAVAGLLTGPKASLAQTNVAYTYQNVLIGCEGQVTGMQSHPLNGNLVYLRGDGAAYRFNSGPGNWTAISDNLPPVSDGVTAAGASIPEALGLDPNSQNIIYAGIGGGVTRSTNQGATWSAVVHILNSSGVPITQNWNGTGKNENNRIAVDPNNSLVVYYGSNMDGLFKSTNSGTTWSKITAFPTDAAPGDVVAFDKGGGTTTVGGQTVSAVIYVGVSAGTSTDNGVWKSSNGGASWTHLTGFAMDVEQAMITTNGTLYVVGAGTGGVGKVTRGATTVTNITPSTASSYDAIGVDLTDANGNTAMVADNAFCNPPGGCQHVWRTTNGGTSWSNIIGTGVNAVPWSPDPGPPMQDIQTVCFNSQNGAIAWIGDSFAPWQTTNVAAGSPVWTVIYSGYEDMTGMWPFCPPSGASLLTGCMDPSAFRTTNVTQFPTQVAPVGGRVQQIGWCESDPNYVALASYGGYYGYTGNSGYSTSTNNMLTTTNVTSTTMGGSMIVTSTKQANGKPVIFWMPLTATGSNPPLRSTDWGATWVTVTGLPSNIQCPYWQSEEFVSPDKVNGSKVYVSNIFDGTFWRSTDGAASFQQVSSLPLTNQLGFHVEAQHGIEGKIWINPQAGNLEYSTDSGSTWTTVANLTSVLFYALGAPASGFTTPALYVYGNEAGNFGIWRSDNATSLTGTLSGATWVRIWNPATDTQLPYRANSLGADYQTYGRVYFTVAGRGVVYGVPTSGGIPPAPTGLTATAGNTQISLSWNSSSGATSYNVYRGTSAGGESGTAIATGISTTSYTNTGLTNGTTYYYTVKAVNSSGTSGASNEASATPNVSIPPAPTGLTATPGNTQIALAWNASSGATTYNVYRGTTSGGESGTAIATGISTTSYTNTGLTNGTTYYYTVKAVNSAGTSGASNEASATPSSGGESPWSGTACGGSAWAVPGTIQAENYDCGGEGVAYHDSDSTNNGGQYRTDGVDIETCSDTGGGYDVGWTAAGEWEKFTSNVSATGNYNIAFRVSSPNTSTCHLQDTNGTNLTGTVNIPNTGGSQNWTTVTINNVALTSGSHTFELVEDGGGQNINWFSFTSAGGAPPAPTGLTATPGNAQVALTWNASTGATSYNVLRSTVSGSGYASVATGISTTTYTNTGLTNGTTYYFVVTATNSSGTSGNSNQASATPVGIPSAPTGLTATPGNAQVALAWNASTGATAYDVKRSTVSGSGYVTVSSPATTSYTNTGLTNGTTYYFVVDAKNASGTSGNSAQASATPTNYTGTPWSGTACGGSAWAIPGTLQSENFDCGGEGVAYHDNDSTNNGGQYRTTDGVDIEGTGDTGGGYDVGWTNAGEWMKYTVNVATAKTYTINFRVSSPNTATCHLIDTNGTNLTGTVNIPNTSGGQNWTTVTVNNVSLTAGSHVIEFYEDGGGFNINWISFQ